MDGERKKIELLNPFEEAIELTKKILFQPFVFEKWLVIGFAAFLSGHFSATGFNFNFPLRNHRLQTNHITLLPNFGQWEPWLVILILVGSLMFLALIVVFMWLKARGNFIFTDCIVRDRGKIAEPWREYRTEGNSYFLFLLLVMLGTIVILGLLCLFGFAAFGFFGAGFNDAKMTPLFFIFLGLFFLMWMCFAFFFGLTSYFMVPVMYVRRCGATVAYREVFGLILDYPGSFILFCLFGSCLVVGMLMIGVVVTCLTCCLAALPYVG
ncbi:MAG TPA: hypothetical protein VEI58_05100, partial [Chthoniobacterales bacterium]|nr:hypothetical protein [Chthoniobacterales bacterium]